jgi:hypothetical protein
VKVIISTADVSAERRKLAQELGAIGICSKLQDLNDLVGIATGLHIDYPPKLTALTAENDSTLYNKEVVSLINTPGVGAMHRHSVFISFSQAEREFVRRLANDLWQHGVDARLGSPFVAMGDASENPVREMIHQSDIMLVVVSRHSLDSPWLEREIYEGIVRERDAKRRFVVPLVIDDEAVTNMPFFIRRRTYADFRRDYEIGRANLLGIIKTLTCRKE